MNILSGPDACGWHMTPVFSLHHTGRHYECRYGGFGPYDICIPAFRNMALPHWEGPLPKQIRLHLKADNRGKWSWDLHRAYELNVGGRRALTTMWMDDALQSLFGGLTHGRFFAEMEVIEL